VSDHPDIGPATLVATQFGCLPFTTVPDCLLTLHDRDVILVSKHSAGPSWSNPLHGNFTAQLLFRLPAGAVLSSNRVGPRSTGPSKARRSGS
jgi:hypothetical protein